MKTYLLAALAATALALPAFAAEGNGEPFPNYSAFGTTTVVAQQRADVGSNAYPNVVGRPGSVLNVFAGGVVPDTGNEQPIQTANSLPRGFEEGMPAYAHLTPAQPTLVTQFSALQNR